MSKLPSSAKKVISVVVALGMIISLFSCMSGLSAFAIDNGAVIVAEKTEKGETQTVSTAANAGTHTHCSCGAQEGISGTGVPINASTHKEHKYTTVFAPLTQADIDAGSATNKDGGTTKFTAGSLPSGNAWCLAEDITVTKPLSCPYAYIFCFNGHTITYAASETSSLIKFADATSAKEVSFCDCGGADGTAKGGIKVTGTLSQPNGGIFSIQQSNFPITLRVYGGKYDISETTMSSSGGVLYVGNKNGHNAASDTEVENFAMLYQPEFIGSSGANGIYGGLINVRGKSKVSTYGGKYHDGYVPQTGTTYGGLVCTMGSSKFTSWGGQFYASDDTAANPTAGKATCGGLFAARETSTIELSAGTFTGGTATWGGVVYGATGTTLKVSGASTVVSGGKADNASAQAGGGCIHVSSGCSLTVSGGATVKDGKVNSPTTNANGGCIFNAGTVSLDGAKIDATNSTLTGKSHMGIAVYSNGAGGLTIKDSEITGSKNYCAWGTVYANSGLSITGNTKIHGGNCYRGSALYKEGSGEATIELGDEGIIDNIADLGNKVNTGGLIHVGVGTLTIKSGNFVGADVMSKDATNYTGTGGLIYSAAGTTLNINGGTFTGGKAKLGGGFFVSGNFAMTAGTVEQGESTSSGGGNMFLSSANAVISGGTIKDGKVLNWASGANIYVDSDKSLSISGTASIENGAAGSGGNLYLASGASVTMDGGTIKDGHSYDDRVVESKGGNVYIGTGASFELKSGEIKDGYVLGRGGNICIAEFETTGSKPAGNYYQSGGTVSGGKCYDWYSDGAAKTKPSASGFGGGNIYAGGLCQISGGVVTGGQYLVKLATNKGGGGNISAGASSSKVVISGGEISNGIDDFGQTGNISMWYLAPADSLVITGGTIKNDVTEAPEGFNAGGVRVFFSSGIDKVLDLSGDAVIDDLLTIQDGCHIKVTSFTGSVSALSTNKTAIIGKDWDKDYVDAGNIKIVVDENGDPYYDYNYNSGAPILVGAATSEFLEKIGDGEELGLGDLSSERTYEGFSNEVKDVIKTVYGIDGTEESDMLSKAAGFEDMLKVEVEVVENYGGGDKTLFILHSGMDENAASYDAARIVITINGKTVGNTDDKNINDAYKTIIYDSVTEYDADADKTDIEEYVYFTTVALKNSNISADVDYTFYARILVDGKWVSTKEANRNTGKLTDLIPA